MRAATVEIDSGHLSLITHPDEVTQLVMNAIDEVRDARLADAQEGQRSGRHIG